MEGVGFSMSGDTTTGLRGRAEPMSVITTRISVLPKWNLKVMFQRQICSVLSKIHVVGKSYI